MGRLNGIAVALVTLLVAAGTEIGTKSLHSYSLSAISLALASGNDPVARVLMAAMTGW